MTRDELQTVVNAIASRVVAPGGFVSSGAAKPENPPSGERSQVRLAHTPTVPVSGSVEEIVSLIDHTNLRPEARRDDIVRLCEEAARYRFATVCVHSIWASLAHRVLRGTGVAVCTVAGFPTGAVPTAVKCVEAETAVRNGASEVDMVLAIGLLRQGEWDMVQQDIASVAKVTQASGARLKVILETAALDEREIAIACALSRIAGAHFVKTSTGFHPAGGASVEAVALMRQVVGDEMGVKASGGIRTAEDALAMVAAGATRIGASASVSIVEALRK